VLALISLYSATLALPQYFYITASLTIWFPIP